MSTPVTRVTTFYQMYLTEVLPMKRPLSLFAFILLVTFSLSTTARAEKVFTITSEPAGARVEINGQYVGTTPLQQ
jgi:hypothetical protein